MEKVTRIICSNCGAELQGIPAHQYTTLANVIGLDSNLGTITLPMSGGCQHSTTESATVPNASPSGSATAPMTPAMRRLAAMQQAGISTEGVIPMRSASGEQDMLARLTADGLQMIEDDPVVAAILQNGTTRNAHLFKQWVMSQFLTKASNCTHNWRQQDYTCDRDKDGKMELSRDNLFKYGIWCKRSWELLNDMLIRQRAMWAHNDMRCYNEDNRWYNQQLAIDMFEHYFHTFKTLVKHLKVRRCKGVAYVRIPNAHKLLGIDSRAYKGTFLDDLSAKIYKPLRAMGDAIKNATNPLELRCAVQNFYDHMIGITDHRWNYRGTGLANITMEKNYQDKMVERVRINYKKTTCSAFYNAYMGYGAYFTMQNMIRFHGCLVHDGDQVLTKEQSLAWLDNHAEQSRNNAWWMFGACRALVKDNDFDICKKKVEWAEAAQQRRNSEL